ncbi:hypothetical protein H7849_00540 [Alloacidobacterium dinghuense]|uniref:Uncharacterized protein n=1 Tax=Alloacidobacterium dinghuense TaxID=2763107 RepID=A0A7G8BJ34_9BACT|nr:hypothetical protein [Alloacidobacterium dinghuense]QNI32554.1 hypothetical protein H7849_00540 [Alloacidobacterium dinghuense]
MIPETRSNIGNEVVVAYFSDNANAQRALDDLLAEGFEPRQMGAAFRNSTARTRVAAAREMDEVGSRTVHNPIESDTVGSGPASDTRAVTPAGLSTGSGSVISGAGRPGPIPGSDIPHHQSTTATGKAPTVADPLPATGGFHEAHEHDEGWWQKLKHFFYGEEAKEGRSKGVASETSMNFGTGEGHLATYPDNYEYAYSGSAFESAFSGMGVTQSNARSLVGSLQQGGAIVSVDAAGRLADAERILERNNGRIRYEATAEAATWSDIPGERVRIFGRLSRTYPGYLAGSDASSRKAS